MQWSQARAVHQKRRDTAVIRNNTCQLATANPPRHHPCKRACVVKGGAARQALQELGVGTPRHAPQVLQQGGAGGALCARPRLDAQLALWNVHHPLQRGGRGGGRTGGGRLLD